MSAAEQKLWSKPEEARLLIWAIAGKPLADFARASGRSPTSVRVKLCRLRSDPETSPPDFTQDAAVPRVPTARGPSDTSDSHD